MVKYVVSGILLFAIGCLGWCVLQRTDIAATVVSEIAAGGGLIGLLVGMRFARNRLSGTIAGVLIGAVALPSAILSANFFTADPENGENIEATVDSKHTSVSYGQRRVGRRYVADTSRKIHHYYYTLRLPDGNTIEQQTDARGYSRIRTGQKRTIRICAGCFGWPVAMAPRK